ncbi:hypothetical protein [Wolbachia endosymbiont of Folsomia candida]|uniref:hypothetical protein n=1 Tax=Wolbachia endosymbiont of Folsomia candida TaxID=169402 RepID=UPI000B1DD4C3|nr:hypothetical protein [Wolbachia endosymbiont of Folsomia candida]APR98257.1 hypothetical protein ASM33_03050 [Wolbachia endosymbiont of Folsomia candida]
MKTSHDNQKEKYTQEEWNRFVETKWDKFIDIQKKEYNRDGILNEIEKTRSREREAFQDVPSKHVIPPILNKHLKDNVVIHSSNEFKETAGPSTNDAKTVTYKDSTCNGTRFVEKLQSLEETVTEVIAGIFYHNVLLYDRSPVFTLVKNPGCETHPLALKSKFLDNFVTLCEYMHEKKAEKLLHLVCKKLSNEDGQNELAVYMATSLYTVGELKGFIKKFQKKMKEPEEFLDNILEKLSDEHIIEYLNKEYAEGKLDKNKYDGLKEDPEYTELQGLLELKDILVQIFEQCKNMEREAVYELLSWPLQIYIKETDNKRKELLGSLNSWSEKHYQNGPLIKKTKEEIRELTLLYKSLNTIPARLNTEEFNKKFLAEITKEIKKAKGIKEELINCINQELNEEVSGIEKIITSMMLLGYYDLHGGNIGVMGIKCEDGNKIAKEVYGKVDMTSSFDNLEYTNYLQYIESFEYMINPEVKDGYNTEWRTVVNYIKLSEEIKEATGPAIQNIEYVESLIHRALFYEKPLLRTKKELDLVTELAEAIIKQAGLLRQFANSEEFWNLKDYIASGYKNYIAWAVDNDKKIQGQDPITYVMDNNLLDSLIWKLKSQDNDKREEYFNWLKANTHNTFVQKWLEQYSLVNLDSFQDHNDCIKYCNNVNVQREGYDQPLKNKDKSIIKRLTEAVKANLNYNSPQNEQRRRWPIVEVTSPAIDTPEEDPKKPAEQVEKPNQNVEQAAPSSTIDLSAIDTKTTCNRKR